MEWLEVTASSVQEAKEKALEHLGVDEQDAEYEVLSEGKTGLFGRLKEEARVRARIVPTPVRAKTGYNRSKGARRGNRQPQTQKRSSSLTEADHQTNDSVPKRLDSSVRRTGTSSAKKAHSVDAQGARHAGLNLDEQAEMAETFVRGIAQRLDLSVTFVRHGPRNGVLRIEAVGDSIGVLIGHRETTSQAIDELTRMVLQRSGGSVEHGRIRIDVGGVRARRVASLTDFTKKLALEVSEMGSEVAMEPMNRVDRKIVHDTIAGIDSVESYSEGEEPNRRVVLRSRLD